MKIRNQERNVIALDQPLSPPVRYTAKDLPIPYLNRLPPQNEERLSALRQKPSELVNQDMFYFIGLLDLYTDAYTIDTRLDEDLLVLVSRYCQRIQEELR